MLRGVDRASFAAAFVARLRAAGVPADARDLVHALEIGVPGSTGELYWTARITLVRRVEEIAAFDAVFFGLFTADGLLVTTPARRGAGDERGVPVPAGNRGTTDRADLPWSLLPDAVAEHDTATGTGYAVSLRLPSAMPACADRPFDRLDPDELALLGAWLREAARRWPTRPSRRVAPHHHGTRIAWRRTMARSRRTGGELLTLVRVKPVRKPRRVVMLCDVSRSMQAQATAYLHLMRAVTTVTGAEVFAFATSLTRLTATLAHRDPAAAVSAASAAVDDRFGGTRIATNLRALLASRHGESLRGAVVVIGSDGWDSDPPPALSAAMARLRRRAHRVIWMNPRAGTPGFEPRVAAMAAALPYCDALLPADTFRSLAAVLDRIGSTP